MKKRKSKKGCIILLMILLSGAAAVCYYGKNQREAEAAQIGQSVIEAEEGESVLYAQIDSIIGNEISIQLLDFSDSEGRISYEMRDEQREYCIPVGTQVETRLGSITTFTRLSAGDKIAMLLAPKDETEEIVKIWIVG